MVHMMMVRKLHQSRGPEPASRLHIKGRVRDFFGRHPEAPTRVPQVVRRVHVPDDRLGPRVDRHMHVHVGSAVDDRAVLRLEGCFTIWNVRSITTPEIGSGGHGSVV